MAMKKIALLSLIAAMVWSGAILSLTTSIPVGIAVGKDKVSGKISMTTVVDGAVTETPLSDIAPGYVGFHIPRRASSFHFNLRSDDDNVCFPLESIKFYGIPLLTPQNIPHFQMEQSLYSTVPRAGDPLCITGSNRCVLNLPNVFPVALRLFRMGILAVALLPFLVLAVFWLCYFCGRRITLMLDGILSKPVVFVVSLIAGTILLMPVPIRPACPGLDESWLWLLNKFAFSGAIGRDLVFTYGPLGFLISPQLSLANVCTGIVVNILFLAVSFWVVFLSYRTAQTFSARFCVYWASVVWFLPWPNGMEWRWCAIGVTTVALAAFNRRMREEERLLLFVFGAILALIQSFVKFSNCVSVIAQQMSFLLMYIAWKRRASLRCCVAYLGTLLLAFIVGSAILFPSFDALVNWIHGSIEIASGYNLYMCTEKPLTDYIVPFVFLLMIPVSWALFCRARIHRAVIWMTLAPLLFCAYKYSVVRQGVEPLLLLTAWISALLSVDDAEFRRNGLTVSALCVFMLLGVRAVFCGQFSLVGYSVTNIASTLNLGAKIAEVRDIEKSNLAAVHLPRAMLNVVGTNGVMNIGADYGTAMSGDYSVIPFPATQNYSAYTRYLERKCLDRLSDPEHPVPFVLMPEVPQSFDSRNVCLDNLRLWYYVRKNYAVVGVACGQILLRRRTSPRKDDSQSERMFLRYTLGERVRGLFFRVPRIMARIRYENGTECVYAANPATIDGVRLPPFLPRTSNDVRKFFAEDSAGLPHVLTINFERY